MSDAVERARLAWLDAVFTYSEHVEHCAACAVGPTRCEEGRRLAREDGRLWDVYQSARLGVGVFA